MKFKSSVSDLKLALTKAKNTISSKDNTPCLRNFCLKLQGNELTIMATDLDLSTVCKLEVSGSEDGLITIPGQQLFSIVSSATSEEISIETSENKATIVSGRFNASLQTLPADDFPTLADFEEANPLKAGRQDFLDTLNRISFSISDNESRKNLLAVFINDGYCQASDGHCSAVSHFEGNINNTLIPSLAVPDLVRILRNSSSEFIEIAATDSFLLFRLDKDVFITRLSQAVFPDLIKKVMKPTEKNPISCSVDKKELVHAISRVAVTANANSLAVNFKFEGNELVLTSADVNGNISEEKLDATCSEPANFNLNYEYVLDICKSLTCEKFEMKIHPNLRIPIRIEDGDFIVLLMRLASTVDAKKAEEEKSAE